MKYKYIITLNTGQVVLANDYYSISSNEMRIEGVAEKGLYTFDVLKDEILVIEINRDIP